MHARMCVSCCCYSDCFCVCVLLSELRVSQLCLPTAAPDSAGYYNMTFNTDLHIWHLMSTRFWPNAQTDKIIQVNPFVVHFELQSICHGNHGSNPEHLDM